MNDIEDFVEDLEGAEEGGRLIVILEFLRRHKKRKARSLATQVTDCMVRKWLHDGWRRCDIADMLGITERRVYQIQKNMK